MEITAASVSAYQQQNIQAEVGIEVAAQAIQQFRKEGELAVDLIQSAALPTDANTAIGRNIDVRV